MPLPPKEAILFPSRIKFLFPPEETKISLRKEGPGGGRLNVKRLTCLLENRRKFVIGI